MNTAGKQMYMVNLSSIFIIFYIIAVKIIIIFIIEHCSIILNLFILS